MEKKWKLAVFGIAGSLVIGMLSLAAAYFLGQSSATISTAADILNLAFVGIGIVVAIGVTFPAAEDRRLRRDPALASDTPPTDVSGIVIVNGTDGGVSITRNGLSVQIEVGASPGGVEPRGNPEQAA